MKVTFETLANKFEDKGVSLTTLFLNLPPIPIFDPSYLELSCLPREELYDTFKRVNDWRFKHYNEKLQELDVWIDHQNYK